MHHAVKYEEIYKKTLKRFTKTGDIHSFNAHVWYFYRISFNCSIVYTVQLYIQFLEMIKLRIYAVILKDLVGKWLDRVTHISAPL